MPLTAGEARLAAKRFRTWKRYDRRTFGAIQQEDGSFEDPPIGLEDIEQLDADNCRFAGPVVHVGISRGMLDLESKTSYRPSANELRLAQLEILRQVIDDLRDVLGVRRFTPVFDDPVATAEYLERWASREEKANVS